VANAAALPEPGDIVGGKYRVERKLGSGGMGAVFEVTHRVTDKRFAVKWLLPDVAANDGAVKRFIREAQVAGRFVHPNVVEVYDLGQDDGSFYMVMELLSGESLAERLERVGRLSTQQACEILVPCMEGVAAAHAAGIIHRDLKPANIFVCAARGRSPEEPKVLDFGVSKLAAQPGVTDATLTHAGAVIGTPHYMAPEQLRAQAIDARADIYAFGVILYQALAGQRPYDAGSYADLVLHVMTDTPRPLRERAPDLRAGVAEAVMRAMARDKNARFADLSQLIAALEPYYRAPAHASSQQPAAERGEIRQTSQPETPLASESIPSPSPLRFGSHRTQLWLAGTFGAVLLIAFIAAIFSRPDTSSLRTTTTNAVHQLTPEPEPKPEPEPIEIHLEPAADEPAQVLPAVEPAAEPPLPLQLPAAPPALEPRKPPRRRSKPSADLQPTTIRPRVPLNADDFDAPPERAPRKH
jgi:serine/threonine protein kinase